MLKPMRSRGVRVATLNTESMPAPIGGWNQRDSLADMEPTDAVILDNFFPMASDVRLRDGFTNHITGITGAVNTLCAYNSPTANKLFGAAGANIYNVTTAGAVGAAVVTGQTSDQWQHVNFSTPGGSFMYLANGSDSMQLYDGTAWTTVDAASTPAITGVTTSTIIHLNVFKTRIWMVERSSMRVWYLPVNSIGGAASSLDFSSIFKLGGYLMAMGTWSLDAGQGLDDYAVFITSQGEVAVYKGTDPASASTWSLVGVFVIGAPIGRRCLEKFAGDLLMIGRDGLVPMSQALMSSRVNSKIALTDKIQEAVSEATTAYGGNFGWQTVLYPAENMLLVNVPISSTESHQHVMNTITKAWCRFTGWNATCWERFNDLIYFGTNGGVKLAWSGQSDNNANINAEALQAFHYFGNNGQIDLFTMVRPVLSANGTPGISVGVNVDFDVSSPVSIPTFSSNPAAIWDAAIWDADIWSGDYVIKKDWVSVNAYGKCAAIHIKTASRSTKLKWAATDFNFQPGGFL